MTINIKSIEALRNPETIAKSLATRKQNSENKKLLKERLAYEKLDAESSKLLSTIKNQVSEEHNTLLKLSNLEYSNKSLESVIDNIKEQLKINTTAITELNNKSNLINPINSNDNEARDRIKKTIKSFNNAIEEINETQEQNTTDIVNINKKIDEIDKDITNKIDTLFKLFYNTQPKTNNLNNYCPYYNCEVVSNGLSGNILRPSNNYY
jgi:chromosome segregation ATPase